MSLISAPTAVVTPVAATPTVVTTVVATPVVDTSTFSDDDSRWGTSMPDESHDLEWEQIVFGQRNTRKVDPSWYAD